METKLLYIILFIILLVIMMIYYSYSKRLKLVKITKKEIEKINE
jgi:hypothetical protein